MSGKKRYLFRYLLIALVFCTVCAIYVGRLFYVQIAGREQAYDDGTETVTVKLQAVRGEILDRNGEELVSNRYTYDLVLSYSALSTVGPTRSNQIYLRLLEALDACGVGEAHKESHFPFHGTYPNYAFSPEATDENTSVGYRLQRILKDKGMDADSTVKDIVDEYVDTYRLLETDGAGKRVYTDYEVDRLLRLRYDMDVMQFNGNNNYTFASNTDLTLMTYIKEMGLLGVTFEVTAERVYNYPGYASHILGSVGPIYAEEWDYYNEQGYPMNAIVGKSGCEAAFEEHLRGTDGEMKVTVDRSGNVIRTELIKAPVSGKDVYLTVDIRLQIAAEDALRENVEYVRENDAEAIEGFESDSGAAVVMDPNTFEILAIASYPTFDLTTFNADYNSLLADAARPLTNRALRETYAPGSTFKVGVALAGLNQGEIDRNSSILCTGVYTKLPGTYQPNCSTYPHATAHLTVTQALADSCNCFFYELGLRLRISGIDECMARLGFGRGTGIELGEEIGILAGEAGTYLGTWYDGDTVQAAIGQSDSRATPLQLCAYISTLVNGGTRYSAHLLDRVCAFGSAEPSYSDESILSAPLDQMEIPAEHLSTLMIGMKQMVRDSQRARTFLSQSGVDYTLVGGKTGTAQFDRYVKDEATGETVKHTLTNALFVSVYAPDSKPELTVSVVIEKATSGTYASLTAARIFGAWEDIKE